MLEPIRLNRRIPLLAVAVTVVLAACNAGTEASPSNEATASPTAEATASVTAEATPTEEPTPSPTATVEPTEAATEEPTAVPSIDAGEPGGFTVAPNPEADALFIERDECQNLRDGYQLEFPEDWYTNTEIGRFPPCIWFAPGFYTVPDVTQVPDEIAITIEYMDGDSGSFEDPIRREVIVVGGQNAVREEDEDVYRYQIQLGPTPEEGPNLVVTTSREMGGDYELNKAVLDRIMATIEFIGSIQ